VNPARKRAWVEALRSDAYRQGKGYLKTVTPDRGAEFCCLGVLCDLAVKAGVIPEPVTVDGVDGYAFGDAIAALPARVKEWAGLSHVNPPVDVPRRTSLADRTSLASLNDNGSSFAKIADLIEAYL
jgi:hypothetical protein